MSAHHREGEIMIQIFRPTYHGVPYHCAINVFNEREWVDATEVVIKTKNYFGKDYVYAEPVEAGTYAFGGTLLHDSGDPLFATPIKLHDRNMALEYAYTKEAIK
jgi:hypothetical protein